MMTIKTLCGRGLAFAGSAAMTGLLLSVTQPPGQMAADIPALPALAQNEDIDPCWHDDGRPEGPRPCLPRPAPQPQPQPGHASGTAFG